MPSDNRPIVYYDDEISSFVYRASGLGSCARALVAARRGLEPRPIDPDSLRVMEEGNLHEPAVLQQLQLDGYELLDTGQQEVALHIPGTNAVVRGHIDGSTSDFIVEVKARSRSSYLRWLREGLAAFPEMGWQVSIYRWALGKPILVATKNRDNGDVNIQIFDQNVPHSLYDIESRVQLIEEWAEGMDAWPPCEANKSYFCKYPYLHDDYEEPGPGQGPTERYRGGSVMDSLAARFQQAKAKVTAGEAELASIRDEMEKILKEHPDVETTNYYIELRPIHRRWLDSSLVRKKLGKQVEECYNTSESTMLIVEERQRERKVA